MHFQLHSCSIVRLYTQYDVERMSLQQKYTISVRNTLRSMTLGKQHECRNVISFKLHAFVVAELQHGINVQYDI